MRRRALVPLALFAGAALIAAVTVLREIDAFDEGLILSAARRVGEGQVPYRDFLWSYGPAQPYLLAGLAKLFGESLLWWRILWALACAAVALAAWALVRPAAGARWALVAFLTAALGAAQPRIPNPLLFALAAGMGALLVAVREDRPARRRAVGAGLLVGVAAAFRLDFALYAAAAACVALGAATRSARPALECAAVALAATVLVYLPWAIVVGPGDLYDALVATSLREREYWTLPFPWAYHGLSPSSAKGLKDVLDFYVPAMALAGTAVVGAGALARLVAGRRPPARWLGLLVLCLGALSYLLSRTDGPHVVPLVVLLGAMLALVAGWAVRARPRGGAPIAVAAGLVLALLLAHGAAGLVSALVHPPRLTALRLGAADGVRAHPSEARALEQVVAAIRARVPPGKPIYVAPARSDLVRLSNPLLYVLADRDNATDRDFGLISRAPVQRRIVAQLERSRPRLIVRWTDPRGYRREPNLRGRPSGVHLLDDWLRRNYRLDRRLFHYDVLVPR